MTLGASHLAVLEFLVVFAVALCFGIAYIVRYFLLLTLKSKILVFIYDFIYAIMVGGIFILLMYKLNVCNFKYYHFLSLILGILVGGILPIRLLKIRENSIIAKLERFREQISTSRIYRIIKK